MKTTRAVARRGARVALSELRSVRRQGLQRRLAPLPAGSRLHLGCGPNHFDGWINVDLDAAVRPDLRLDLRLGLPVPERSVSLIYSEHVLEHFSLADGVRIMEDCHRGLAEGGVLRLAMPDLRSIVDHYAGDWRGQEWLQDPAYELVDTPAHMLNYALREWGHRYLYDFEDLEQRLKRVGFDHIERPRWGESADPRLRGLEARHDSKLIVEAFKG
jgi:predicted SAM-dependent methyltransferase